MRKCQQSFGQSNPINLGSPTNFLYFFLKFFSVVFVWEVKYSLDLIIMNYSSSIYFGSKNYLENIYILYECNVMRGGD
jgi:hypothetical protein